MCQITNHDAVSAELHRSYEHARQWAFHRGKEKAAIEDLYQIASEVHNSIRAFETCIDSMDARWAANDAEKLIGQINELLSFDDKSRALFTWRETPVSWRSREADNIVTALSLEAECYHWHLGQFLYPPETVDEALLELKTQIRKRIALDQPRCELPERTEATPKTEPIATWSPEAEKEARRLILERQVTTAKALQSRLSINRQTAQGLYRHIIGKGKRRRHVNSAVLPEVPEVPEVPGT